MATGTRHDKPCAGRDLNIAVPYVDFASGKSMISSYKRVSPTYAYRMVPVYGQPSTNFAVFYLIRTFSSKIACDACHGGHRA